MRPTILILKDPFHSHIKYVIDLVARRWEERGYRVVTHFGHENLPAADIVVLHVAKTRVPSAYREALRRYPVVLNRNVPDLFKRRFSDNLLQKTDDYAGPVIVKTNANYGGKADATFRREGGDDDERPPAYLRSAVDSALFRTFGRRPWARLDTLHPKYYPILSSLRDVPRGVWKNPNLIVEKFIPEMENDLFFVRYYMFLGHRGWCGRFGAREPIVKFSRIATDDERLPVPEKLREVRNALGLDYGRFDYVQHGDRVSVLDANATVGAGAERDDLVPYVDYLADGLDNFL